MLSLKPSHMFGPHESKPSDYAKSKSSPLTENHCWHKSLWNQAKFDFPGKYQCVPWLPEDKLVFWNAVSEIWVSVVW